MKRLREGLISVAIAFAVLAAMEGALRVAGYRHEIAPMSLRFGYPNPREIVDVFQPDPLLFWRMRPGSVFDAEAPVPINAAGYRGHVALSEKLPDAPRVAVMGDSVAFGASTSFPELLEARMTSLLAAPVEVLNFGVPGYSIVQGLRQFDAEVAPLKPDKVIIAYGWNDHWLARGGLTDEERQPATGAMAAVSRSLSKLRIAQALHAVVDRGGAAPAVSPGPDAPRRVPLDEFRAHLEIFIQHVQRAGGMPIVVALPSGLASGEFPEYLVGMGFTRSAAEAIADHRAYADAAHDAAEAAGAEFIDLQPYFERPDGIEPGLFRGDKIHMTDAGNAKIVDALAPVVNPAYAGAR
jgi:lysophospholipase L1-like esterase